MSAPRLLLLGATGLVGRALLRRLEGDARFGPVRTLLRTPPPPGFPVEARVVDFENLEAHADAFEADVAFSALGTTLARAGSREAFRRVDLDLVLAAARLAKAGGVRHFLLVSALGADARSRIFYNRVKGELEEALRDLDFPSLTLARPSLLLGHREESRPAEALGRLVGWLAPPPWRPVQAEDVAGALVQAAAEGRPGVRVLENRDLRRGGRA